MLRKLMLVLGGTMLALTIAIPASASHAKPVKPDKPGQDVPPPPPGAAPPPRPPEPPRPKGVQAPRQPNPQKLKCALSYARLPGK